MGEKMGACAICGKKYPVCRTCLDIQTFKPWRTITDTAEHYKIHIVLSDYTNKRITKSEAKTMLSNCDIKDYKTFLPHIAKAIDEIMTGNKKSVKSIASKKNDTEPDNTDNKDSE